MLSIPRVGGLPLIGALPGFLRDPLGLLERARALGPVSRVGLGLIDAVTLHHPDHVEHVLRTHHRRYPKEGPFWAALSELVGNGLPVARGDVWRRHRRMMQPQFHRRRLQRLGSLIVDALDRSLQWDDVESTWSVHDIGGRIPHLAMNVVSAAVLGLSTSSRRSQVVARELSYALDHMFWAMVCQGLPRAVPLPGRARFGRAEATIRHEVTQIIEQRRRDPGSDDLLTLVIAATDDDTGEGMSDTQLLDEVMSLFLAGYETTATGLQWSLSLLSQSPLHLQRLRAEADAVLGGRLPTYDDLHRLRYARWVMQEALRLYPPVWWVPRMAGQDDEILGYPVRKGTIVAPIPYTVHRHPDLWRHPARFDPERFAPDRARGRHPLAWFPFGAGPRKCIGQELSLMEATLALAMITQRYELTSCGHVTRPSVNTVLRPANGVRLRIRRRNARPMSAGVVVERSHEPSSALDL